MEGFADALASNGDTLDTATDGATLAVDSGSDNGTLSIENHDWPIMAWHGLVTRAPRETRDGVWALLVGGEEWGRCSPSALNHRRSWQQNLAKPTTLNLTEAVHELRACKRTKTPCASIERNTDHKSATLRIHGSGGMVRVNDAWLTEEGCAVEIVLGDVIELVCVQHPTVRQSSGWYTTTCHERDRSGANLVSLVWRFVPQHSCIPMLSPTEEAKNFFFPRLPLTEAVITCGDEQQQVHPCSRSPARRAASPSSPSPHLSKRPRFTAITVKLSTMDDLRRVESSTPHPLPAVMDDWTWW